MDPETGSPVGSTQEFDWESDSNPYKTRFNDYRSEADRRATKLSEYEQHLEDLRSDDEQRQAAAAAALGIELVQDEQDTQYVDPYDELRTELEQVKGQLSDAERRQQEREASAIISARLDAMDLDEADKDWVVARAIALPPGEDKLPDVKAAYDQLVARDTARMQQWQTTKKVPRGIAPGTSATEQKNTDDMTDAERVEWAVNRLDNSE